MLLYVIEQGLMQSQHDLNQKQYHDKSEAYLNSATHAQGVEFSKMQHVCRNYTQAQLLDLGCGGGHVSYQMASAVESIIAYDLSVEMLQLVEAQAQQRGLHNIRTQVGVAEQLPFADHSFDIVISRYSAHHWQSLKKALSEVHRVLKPKGAAIFFDVLGSCDPMLDTFLQCIEMIRDPSHVRDYSLSEWLEWVEYYGFEIDVVEKQSLALDFKAWVQRMKTPAMAVETIRELQEKVSDHVRDYYQIQSDGSFTSPTMYLQMSKA